MSKKKKKYYTVWKGHHTGVFESWDDCKAQIKDFQGKVRVENDPDPRQVYDGPLVVLTSVFSASAHFCIWRRDWA